MLPPFVFHANDSQVLGTPQLPARQPCSGSAQGGLACSSAPLRAQQAAAPLGGKPSAGIYALSPSDEITAMCSHRPPGNGSWSTQALPYCVLLQYGTAPHSPQHLLSICM